MWRSPMVQPLLAAARNPTSQRSRVSKLALVIQSLGKIEKSSLNNLEPCLTLEQIQIVRHQCQQVKVDPAIQKYIIDLVRSTRNDREIGLGVSPRGSVALHRTAQVWAWLEGRSDVLPEDVKDLALSVVAHRIRPNGGRRSPNIMARLLQEVAVIP